MKTKLSLILLLFLSFQPLVAQTFFDNVTVFVSKYVENERVDYSAIRQNSELLDSLIANIATMDTSTMDLTTLKAFYINSYNLLVIDLVLAYYPIESCLEIDGFFDKVKHLMAGDSITLDQIEKSRLKPMGDEKVHFALVCASLSCPPLDAFTPENVDLSLNLIRVNYINSDKAVIITEDKRVLISRIFDWYQDDFLQHAPSLREYINFFRYKSLPKKVDLEYQPYDWALNDLR
ncbi:MAG: DUF547 domain-containing protein [Cyclobacteriaceae bacterium]